MIAWERYCARVGLHSQTVDRAKRHQRHKAHNLKVVGSNPTPAINLFIVRPGDMGNKTYLVWGFRCQGLRFIFPVPATIDSWRGLEPVKMGVL